MRTLKVMNEAQFLAGEDARGVLVILEPETELTNEHLDALAARDAAGFISDFTEERFEKPDEKPALSYDTTRYAKLLAVPVSPRQGVRLRTLAGTGFLKLTIEALIEAVGPDGNFFVPTFQRSECYLNGINKRWDHRPSDFRDRASEALRWVGTLPLEFMRLHPDAPRGVHLSHSWAGWGRNAADVLSRQTEDEPPFSDNSCPMVVRDMGGKILHFGSPIGHTSFVHCLETHFDLPGLGPSYYDTRLADGTITWKFVPKGLPGPREFYSKDEHARFFREAAARGLEIRRAPLGVGRLALMDCRQFWDIGSVLVTEDPRIVIGDL